MRSRGLDGPAIGMYAATIALMIATAFAGARSFVDLAPLADYLVVIGVAACTMAVGRLARLAPGLAFAAAQPIGLVVVAVVFELPHRAAGIAPTLSTLRAVRSEMTESFATFLDAVPPVEVSIGFVVPLALLLWFATTFGIFAAVEANSPLHATAAPLALFVATSVLLRGTHAIGATIAICAALALMRVATVAVRTDRHARSGARATRGADRPAVSVWATAVPTLAIAGALAALVSLAVPTTGPGLVDLRELGRRDPPRTVESPLVSVSALLRGSADVVLFRVRSDASHYWRLTSLDRFDGRSWSSNSAYSKVTSGERLRSNAPVETTTVEAVHEFELESTFSDWVPTAYQPIEVVADATVQFDPESSSVFLPNEATANGLRSYVVRSVVPVLDTEALQRAQPDPVRAAGAEDLSEISPVAIELARMLGAERPPLEAALALESFFHHESFSYDTTANYGSSQDPLGDFLSARVGFCQQYATAFAAMARVLGIPSRVAVGFVPGDAEPIADGRFEFTVSSQDGHAWPELYFEGLGWIPFEPTPGRSNPDANDYSTAPPAVSQNQQPAATTTVPVPTTAANPAQDSATPPTTAPAIAAASPDEVQRTGDERRSAWRWLAAGAILIISALAVAGRVAQTKHARQRRADPARPDPERVAAAWEQALIDLGLLGVVPTPAETPLEFGERATDLLARLPERFAVVAAGGDEPLDLLPLASLEAQRRYAAGRLTPQDAALASNIAARLHDSVWALLDTRSRARALLSGR